MSTSLQLLNAKASDILNDLFRRDDDGTHPGGTKKYQASIDLTMGLMRRLRGISDGIAVASTSAESDTIFVDETLSSELVGSIHEQLAASAGKLKSFGENPKVRSFYLASSPEDIQLIKGVRLTCEFEERSEPIELTVVFDDKDTLHYVYLAQADGNLVFAVPNTVTNENNRVRDDYLKEFARHIIYEMAQERYKRIEKFFALPNREGLNLNNFIDEFAGCEFSSIQWGSILLTPIPDGKHMVNLSLSFERRGRQPFDQGLLLIFNDEDMLEMMDFFTD